MISVVAALLGRGQQVYRYFS